MKRNEIKEKLDNLKIFLEESNEEQFNLVAQSSLWHDESLWNTIDSFFFEKIHAPEWPVAVDPSYICQSTFEDKWIRAGAIISHWFKIGMAVHNVRFLDFGCGEGHTIQRVVQHIPAKAVGYDCISSDNWDNSCIFTTDENIVKQEGPYDVILLYDVLDHIVNVDVVQVLTFIRSILASGGKVYVRCHPWCSKHGTHLFHQINKAYIHLVYSEKELNHMGYQGIPTRKVLHPDNTYREWFLAAGFQIEYDKEISEPHGYWIHDNPFVSNKIKSHWLDKKTFPAAQIDQQFHDYVLR